MPIIAKGNIHGYWVVKTHIIACGVIKTTLNNHPSHVGWDTRPQFRDTRPVDLENSYWINIAKNIVIFLIYLYFVHSNHVCDCGRCHGDRVGAQDCEVCGALEYTLHLSNNFRDVGPMNDLGLSFLDELGRRIADCTGEWRCEGNRKIYFSVFRWPSNGSIPFCFVTALLMHHVRDHARSAVQNFTFYNNLWCLQELSTEGEKITWQFLQWCCNMVNQFKGTLHLPQSTVTMIYSN